MDSKTTELLARIEILEDEVKSIQSQIDDVGIVFEADMDMISPDWLLFVDEETEH